MRASEPTQLEAIEPHIGFAVNYEKGRVFVNGRGPLSAILEDKLFSVGARIVGEVDVLLEGSIGRYNQLRHPEGTALAVELRGASAVHKLGYIASRDDTRTDKELLAQAAYDAVNGVETLDPLKLIINHSLYTTELHRHIRRRLGSRLVGLQALCPSSVNAQE